MSKKEVRMQNAKDSTANWNSANPTLLDGELGFEVKSNKEVSMRVGNGTTDWKNLKATYYTPSEVDAKDKALQSQIDNIVTSSSGTGDVTAEVVQARTDASGTTHKTLKTRIDELDSREQAYDKALQIQINNIVTSSTATGSAAAEVAQARVDTNGKSYNTLKERLDSTDNKLTEVADDVACNLFDYNEFNIIVTDGKITFTNNGDGTITVNGTADTRIEIRFIDVWKKNNYIVTKNTTYTLSGAPEGASETTYGLVVKNIDSDSHDVWCYKTATFNTGNSRLDKISFCIFIEKGQTVSNLTFKPMLEVGTVAHSFVPYTGGIGKLNGEVAELKSKYYDTKNLVGNMYNLIDTSLISSTTANGITRTNNNDGSITYTGTSTATTDVFVPLMASKSLNVGVYVFKPNPANINENYYYQIYKGGTYWKELSIDDPIEIISYGNYSIGIAVKSGESINNNFKPMLEVKRKLYNLPNWVGYTGGTGALNSDVAAIESRTKTTDWIDLLSKTSSNISDITSGSFLKYKRQGNIINVIGNITYTSDASHSGIAMYLFQKDVADKIAPSFAPDNFGISATNQNGVYVSFQRLGATGQTTALNLLIYFQREDVFKLTRVNEQVIIGKGQSYQFSMTYLV